MIHKHPHVRILRRQKLCKLYHRHLCNTVSARPRFNKRRFNAPDRRRVYDGRAKFRRRGGELFEESSGHEVRGVNVDGHFSPPGHGIGILDTDKGGHDARIVDEDVCGYPLLFQSCEELVDGRGGT